MLAAELAQRDSVRALLSSPGHFLPSLEKSGKISFTKLKKKPRLSSNFLHGGEGRGQGNGRQQRPRLDPLSSLLQTRSSAGHRFWRDDLSERWRGSYGESCFCWLRVSLFRRSRQQPDVPHWRALGLPTFTTAPSAAAWIWGAWECGWKWSTGWAGIWRRGGCFSPLRAAHQPVSFHLMLL